MIESTPWKPMEKTEMELFPKPPNHPFFLKWHPSNFIFQYIEIPVKEEEAKEEELEGKTKKRKKAKKPKTITKGFFLPHLRMERIRPGVNGVHQVRMEIGNPSARIGQLQQAGWVYLDPRKYEYMRTYQVKGGRYHFPIWVEARKIANRVIEKTNHLTRAKVAAEFVLNGTLPTPEDHFMELLIVDAQRHPEQLLHSQHLPQIQKKIDNQYKIIDDMKAALEEYREAGIDVYRDLF